jgi:hypothetical protein
MPTLTRAGRTATLAAWLRRHPLRGYFATAYGISWGGIPLILSTTGFDLVHLWSGDTGLVLVAMLLGPSTAGLACTALLDGRQGLRELRHSRRAGGWAGPGMRPRC